MFYFILVETDLISSNDNVFYGSSFSYWFGDFSFKYNN